MAVKKRIDGLVKFGLIQNNNKLLVVSNDRFNNKII